MAKRKRKTGLKPGAEAPSSLIELRQVVKRYETDAVQFTALKGIDLQVERGEFVVVAGRSGCGKSTLINMLTGIDRPSSGEVYVSGASLTQLSENQLAVWRGRNVGVVFQFFQLLPTLSVIENIMLPMDFCRMYTPRKRRERALALLEDMDLVSHAYKLPAALSGGQQQRVAIARAIANDPPILVADEPTGNLDSATAQSVFRYFRVLLEQGKTILMVTHDEELVKKASRIIRLYDGEIIEDRQNNQQGGAS